MTPTLYSLVINLTVAKSGTLRQTQSRLAHAAFLRMVAAVDAELSAELHTPNSRRPFTISPLVGFGKPRNGQYHLKPGQSGWLRVTLLDAQLFQTFIQYFLSNPRQATLDLHGVSFVVTEILSTNGSHDWAGVDSLEGLFEGWEVAENLDKNITLNFQTATSFNRRTDRAGNRLDHRYTLAMPLPDFVFGSLARSWDMLTGHETSEAVWAFSADHVTVSRHDIQTRMFDFGNNKRQIGFEGKVQFEILDFSSPPIVRHLHRLADLAFFTGVGGKTTQGMGQTRRF